MKPEPPNKANKRQHLGKIRARLLGHNPNLEILDIGTLFHKFPQLQLFGMQGFQTPIQNPYFPRMEANLKLRSHYYYLNSLSFK
uniref:Uncharacterized protein n=1 Tax=Utricularia reniformis TaxID=192314 RepID=A0A1Y0B3L2_9LAMI|nr:hypothetical protein AEK19_MT1802 [Utricularia reniformis]ART31973.1 hypothetical protein AEK19_MT1802 [Utricularia reniformis]